MKCYCAQMIGIIGGTGLYSMDGLTKLETVSISTPFGAPSAPLVKGRLGKNEIAFLPRHGIHHEILPSEINYRANIWALKTVGARRIISVSATGSLQEDIAPGHLALVDQYLDLTKGHRSHTFFGEGLVAHVSTAKPACPDLARNIAVAAEINGVRLHQGKTYACVEGPRLGTRAESFLFRGAGCHLVGMTNIPEAFLAREAQLCYCTIAVATDYDCWLDDPSQHVTLERVMALYRDSLDQVKSVLAAAIAASDPYGSESCKCRQSLHDAVLTPHAALSERKRRFLTFLQE